MDQTQDDYERAVGQLFIDWYNTRERSSFKLVGRAGQAPDLAFRDGDRELRAEVASVYYDAEDAKFKWMGARNRPDAPTGWSGADFHKRLMNSLNAGLADKCGKDYGKGCVLLIYANPMITTVRRMNELLEKIVIPERNPFDGIFLVGQFTPARTIGKPEFHVWQLT